MTELIYLKDSYLREADSKVIEVLDAGVVLDKTIFYPRGGGQPSDRGKLIVGDSIYEVTEVVKDSGKVIHIIPGQKPNVGDVARAVIDWELRYAHMRHHTALHIISGAVYHLYGSDVQITGSQIYSDRARMDISLESLNKEKATEIIEFANKIVGEGRDVIYRFVSREEALAMSGLIRVRPDLIPDEPVLRIVEIAGFDAQLDGGTHVKNTREVGVIKLSKLENKGKRNRRLEIILEPP